MDQPFDRNTGRVLSCPPIRTCCHNLGYISSTNGLGSLNLVLLYVCFEVIHKCTTKLLMLTAMRTWLSTTSSLIGKSCRSCRSFSIMTSQSNTNQSQVSKSFTKTAFLSRRLPLNARIAARRELFSLGTEEIMFCPRMLLTTYIFKSW